MSRVRRLWLPVLAGASAALLVYCTRAETTRPAGGPAELVAISSAAGDASMDASSLREPPEALSLETLTPLLATPGFEAVLAAVEASEPARALRELEAALLAKPPADASKPEVVFVRARLRERSGDSKGALADFEAARGVKWPLAPDAALGAARARLALGDGKGALALAPSITGSRRLERARLMVVADASAALREREALVAALREYITVEQDPDARGRAGLRLASEVAKEAGPGEVNPSALAEAVVLARRVSREARDTELERRADKLVKELEASFRLHPESTPPKESIEERRERLKRLVDLRRFEEAEPFADALLAELGAARQFDALGCDIQQLRIKAVAGRRQWGRALDGLAEPIKRCTQDRDLHARLLFMAGRYAASDKRHSAAVKLYADLEREHADHTLADDSCLNGALSYLELGVEARFTELLQIMPERYPAGDMVIEGVFRLALRRMDKGDWSGAARLLTRAVQLLGEADAIRGQELAGRERYFLARAELTAGRRKQAIELLEEVIRRFPLSYYMLWAHTQLSALDASRAEKLLADTLASVDKEPFSIAGRPEFASPGFVRALALLRVGETQAAVDELDELGLGAANVAPELVWGVSLAYARARAFKLSHDLPRRRLTDWLTRWPSGSWQLAWELAFPRPFSELVEREAKKNEVERSLVYAVMREESAFDPDAVSVANAHGLMQLIVPTAKMVAKGTNLPHDGVSLKRPTVNIALGTRVLAQLERRFGDNPLLAIPAYNAGPGNAKRWLAERPSADFDLWVELIPFLETRRYVKRVLASRATYAFLYEREGSASALSLPLKVQ